MISRRAPPSPCGLLIHYKLTVQLDGRTVQRAIQKQNAGQYSRPKCQPRRHWEEKADVPPCLCSIPSRTEQNQCRQARADHDPKEWLSSSGGYLSHTAQNPIKPRKGMNPKAGSSSKRAGTGSCLPLGIVPTSPISWFIPRTELELKNPQLQPSSSVD